jgi:hypothetical protein
VARISDTDQVRDGANQQRSTFFGGIKFLDECEAVNQIGESDLHCRCKKKERFSKILICHLFDLIELI